MQTYKSSFVVILALSLGILGAGCGTAAPIEPSREPRPASGSVPAPQPSQPASETPTPLPSNVPTDIPTAPNSEVINSSYDAERKIARILLSTPDRADRVFANVSGQLVRNGFLQTSDMTTGDTRTILFTKGNLTMGLTLIQEIDVTNYEVSREER